MPEPNRALERLRQIAHEELAAVESGDVEGLCRTAALLPSAMKALEENPPDLSPRGREIIDEIHASHSAAEAFLKHRMGLVQGELRRCAGGRRSSGAYNLAHGREPSTPTDILG